MIDRHHGSAGGELGSPFLRRAWLRRNRGESSRRLLAAEAVPFRLARDGLVCVGGMASALGDGHGRELITAPLSGDRCFAYELTIGLFRERTFPAAWVRFASGVSFRLHDGCEWGHIEMAEVHAMGPMTPDVWRGPPCALSVRVRRQVEQIFHPDRPRAPGIEALLGRHGVTNPGRFRRIELRERRIIAGDRIKALGLGQREHHPDGDRDGYRAPPLRYIVRAGDGELLLGDP